MSHLRELRRLAVMTIAIAGGTGTLGRRVAAELRSRGQDVRVLSRSSPEYPVDLTTGAGLAVALDGVDVVVDAANDASKQAAKVLVDGSAAPARRRGGGGRRPSCRRVDRGLRPRARAVPAREGRAGARDRGRAGPVDDRARHQFHELIEMALEPAARRHVMPVPRVAYAMLGSLAEADLDHPPGVDGERDDGSATPTSSPA